MGLRPAGKRVRAELTAEIAAPALAVQRLVRDVEAWPGLFPHVQSAKRVGPDDYRVCLTWHGVPLTSVCRLTAPASNCIEVQAIKGFARGLRWRWQIDEINASRTCIRLAIERGSRFAFIGSLLVGSMARQTLSMVTLLAEADAAAHAFA